MLIRNATLADQRVDLRLSSEVEEIGTLQPEPGEAIFDAEGGEVLPGLHDHHIHLLALASHRQSLDLSEFPHLDALAERLTGMDGQGWLRGVSYHESVFGELTRVDLDQLAPVRPLRVQHTSGKLWLLNSAAIEALRLEDPALQSLEGIERDARGQPTGRLFRMDAWLGERIGQALPDLAAAGQALASWGITAVTDTSYTNTRDSKALLESAIPQRLYCMGDDSMEGGHLKIMLDDDRLPELDALVSRNVHTSDTWHVAPPSIPN